MSVSMPRFVFIASTMLSLFFCVAVRAEDAKWLPLFDGKTLDGWEKVGKEDSVWEVKEGEITHYPVVAITCIDGIGATASVYDVSSGTGVDEVVRATAEDAVVTRSSINDVGAVQRGIVARAIRKCRGGSKLVFK